MVKFYFTNRNHIPPGILQSTERCADPLKNDGLRMKKAYEQNRGQGNLARVGRHREGRRDTGEPVYRNLHMVQVATLRRGFAVHNYYLDQCYWYRHAPVGQTQKFVVVLAFKSETPADLPPEIREKMKERKLSYEELQPYIEKHFVERRSFSRDAVQAIRKLARQTWGYVHVWKNPDKTVTVNLNHLRFDEQPINALVIRNSRLVAEKVQSFLEEEDE